MTAPELEPATPEEERERARRLRRLWALLQAGGIVFLLVTSLGLLPTILSAWFPALGPRAAVVVWFVAPALTIGLLVVAALRLRR